MVGFYNLFYDQILVMKHSTEYKLLIIKNARKIKRDGNNGWYTTKETTQIKKRENTLAIIFIDGSTSNKSQDWNQRIWQRNQQPTTLVSVCVLVPYQWFKLVTHQVNSTITILCTLLKHSTNNYDQPMLQHTSR